MRRLGWTARHATRGAVLVAALAAPAPPPPPPPPPPDEPPPAPDVTPTVRHRFHGTLRLNLRVSPAMRDRLQALGIEVDDGALLAVAGRVEGSLGDLSASGLARTLDRGVRLEDLSLALSASRLAIPAEGLVFEGVHAAARVDGEIGSDGGRLTVADATLQAARVRGEGFEAAPVRVAIQGPDDAAAAVLTLGPGLDSLAAELELVLMDPVEVAGEVVGRVAAASAPSRVSWRRGERWSLLTRPELTGVAATLLDGRLDLAGGELALPLALGSSAPEPDVDLDDGRFVVETITLDDQPLPPLAGRAEFQDARTVLDATWPLWEDAPIRIDGTLDLAREAPAATLAAAMPPRAFEFPWELPELLGLSESLAFEGTLGFSAGATYGPAGLTPRAAVTLRDATLGLPRREATFVGVDGSVAIDGFDPLSTPGPQTVSFDLATFGETEITDGAIVLAAEDGEILVDRLALRAGELGAFEAAPFRFDPDRPEIRTTLRGRDMSLARWVELLAGGRAEAEGTLAGEVDVTLREIEGDWNIFVGDGSFVAQPAPAEDRWIRVEDAERLREILETHDPRFATDERLREVRDRIVEALKDFTYDQLRVEFLVENGERVARIVTSGRGRVGPQPQEIGSLTVNLHRFNDVLNSAIALRPALDLFDFGGGDE